MKKSTSDLPKLNKTIIIVLDKFCLDLKNVAWKIPSGEIQCENSFGSIPLMIYSNKETH